MPTIPQLPSATSVSAADDVLISQGGTARATSIGVLLASTQPAIVISPQSLLGRTSLGAGCPEEVDVGLGMSISGGTLVADGLDHANFLMTSSLSAACNLVISNHGSPMLMQASLLRGLFSAGPNVAIDTNGVISATTADTNSLGTVVTGGSIGGLQVVTALAAQDLVAVSHAGSNSAISYTNFLGGITIDQAAPASAVSDSDTLWVAQGSNAMCSQNFSTIWAWIANKLPTYNSPFIEIVASINLDATDHNGRILLCSQPVTLAPLVNDMGSGFQCTVINVSNGNVTLGAGFVTSSGSLLLASWQSAMLCCAMYSGGTIAFAAMPTNSSTVAVPGQVNGVSNSATTATTIALLWQAPGTGGVASLYLVQFRVSGTTNWSTMAFEAGATNCQLTALQPGTSYDIIVAAENTAGVGVASNALTVVTPAFNSPITIPGQVTNLSSSAITSSTIIASWHAPSTGGAVSSYAIQYRPTGTTSWSSAATVGTVTSYQVMGLPPATSYDIVVEALNAAGVGAASATLTVATSSVQLTAPAQVNAVTASAISSYAVQLGWTAQTGSAAATSFTIQYRLTGSLGWISVASIAGTGDTISGLQASTIYDFQVAGINGAGAGPPSAIITAITLAASQSITLIVWNLAPSGTYTAGSGAIGVNAHVTPAATGIQFGFSNSSSSLPTSWTVANLVNTNLWGAYAPTPTTVGTWYAWAEGLDGSAPTVSPIPFLVQ